MDRHGQVLAKSNINSDDETQRIRRVRSRLLSGSTETETDVEVNSVNMKENYCREGFQAWKKFQQISAQMDRGGHTLV